MCFQRLLWNGVEAGAGGEGLAKAYEESFIQSHLSSPSFIHPAPLCSGPEQPQCLDERYRKGPGEWESAGLRALREK